MARRCGAGSSPRTRRILVTVDVKKREQGKLTVGVDVPSKAEVSLLLDRARGRWRPFFVTAIFTGMRASELRGLVWDAVDLDQRVTRAAALLTLAVLAVGPP